MTDMGHPRQRSQEVIRVDQGDFKSTLATQRTNGRDGGPIARSVQADFKKSHIPLEEWLRSRTWYEP